MKVFVQADWWTHGVESIFIRDVLTGRLPPMGFSTINPVHPWWWCNYDDDLYQNVDDLPQNYDNNNQNYGDYHQNWDDCHQNYDDLIIKTMMIIKKFL